MSDQTEAAPQDWDEALAGRIAEALCDAWNSQHANGPRDASVPDEWAEEAFAVLDALGLEPVAEGRFGLWEWPDGSCGWGESFGEGNGKHRVPVFRIRAVENGSEGARS